MASAVKFLIASTLMASCVSYVGCATKKKMSERDFALLTDMGLAVKDKVEPSCYKAYVSESKSPLTDTDVDGLCNTMKLAKTAMSGKSCKAASYTAMLKIVCDALKKSKQDRDDWVKDTYNKAYNKVTKSCQLKAGPGASLTTWLAIEELCDKIKDTDVSDFKKQCPKDDYGELKDAVCGGASAIFTGLMTIGLSLMASFFTKM